MNHRHFSIGFLFMAIRLMSGAVMAQDFFTLFDAQYEVSPRNKYKTENGSSVTISEFGTNLGLPIQRKNGEVVLVGFGYNTLSLQTENINTYPLISPQPEPESVDFQIARFQLGYKKNWNEKFNTVLLGMFRAGADQFDWKSSERQYGAALLFSKIKNERVTFKYGLYTNTDFFGLFLVPLIGLDWKYSEKIRVFGVLPRAMTIQYTINKTFRSGLMFEAPTYSYRYHGAPGIYKNAEGISPYVQNSKNALYLYADVYLTKTIVLQARVGHSVFRRIRYFHADDVTVINVWGIGIGGSREDLASRTFDRMQDGILLNGGIAYRFPLE